MNTFNIIIIIIIIIIIRNDDKQQNIFVVTVYVPTKPKTSALLFRHKY